MVQPDLTELRIAMAELAKDVKEVKTDVAEIRIQTTRTNGRVNKHDTQIAMVRGALAVICFVLPIAGGIVAAVLS